MITQNTSIPSSTYIKKPKYKRLKSLKKITKHYELYLFLLPMLVYFIVFHYIPMYGVQIAFKDYLPSIGIWNSPWAGFEHFTRFFNSYYFTSIIKNTLYISIYSMVAAFPIPIILALLLNEVKNQAFKRTIQTVTYAPHFISVIVLTGMVIAFLSPSNGIINEVIKLLGGTPKPFMSIPEWFPSIYVLSGIWQNTGWNSIIYIAALAGIDVGLHEAAKIDGANRLQRIWHINIPGILPMIIILLILNTGSLMSVGFEKVFLMQNQLNLETSEVISTYVYKSGLIDAQYSFSAAVGLFNSAINFILLVLVNEIAKRIGDTSLW